MDIQDYGAIGELLSSIAVLITLVYLAIQVKEARSAIIAQIYQSRSDTQQDAMLRNANSDAVLDLIVKVSPHANMPSVETIDSLSDKERRRLFFLQAANMMRLDNVCFQLEQGYIPEKDAHEMLAVIELFLPVWRKLDIAPRSPLKRYMAKHMGISW